MRFLPLIFSLLAMGCNSRAVGFDVVSIRPVYGWQDGCNTVTLGGSGFTDATEVRVGDTPIGGLIQEEGILNAGFRMYGVMPPGAPGVFLDVVGTQGGDRGVIPKGYYYVACPGPTYDGISAVDPSVPLVSGAPVAVAGCGLDAAAVLVKVGEAPAVPLTSTCGTGTGSFAAPALPDGTYPVSLVNAAGDVLYPPECTDTASDTASGCLEPATLTYGGAL